jgi:DNA-binding GntR family transcriptional regulator
MTAAAPIRLQPAKKLPLGQTVAHSLREAIYSGRFRPGERIPQAVIAQELGVSQTTIRDAFATLEREGLVKRSVNQGAIVTELSRSDIEEIVSLRTTLEAMAIRRMIQKATAEQLHQLEENIQEMTHSWGPGEVAELDLRFHELLVRFAGHERLLSCWHTLLSQLKLLLVHHNLREPRSLQKTVKNHRQLMALIKARDGQRAVAYLEESGNVYRLQALSE